MKLKFIEWFTKGNNGYAPSINADGSFEHEKTQHMFEAYQAGMAESERKVEQLAAENAALMKFCKDASFDADYEAELGMERGGFTDALNDIKTPSTDSILAEVRNEAGARAVELFAKTLGSPYAVRDEKCYEDGFTRAIEIVRDTQAPRFAAQLRQGGAA